MEFWFIKVYNGTIYKNEVISGASGKKTSVAITSGNAVQFTSPNMCRGYLFRVGDLSTT